MMKYNASKLNPGGYYDKMLNDYIESGFGYQDYKGFENWGQNIFSVKKLHELTNVNRELLFRMYIERGWSNVHDVVVWERSA